MLVEISQETLIELVREKPELWDKTDCNYKDKRIKYKAWDDICQQLKPDFDDLDDADKKTMSNLVMKKWINMKDTWVKHNKRIEEKVPSVYSYPYKKYAHYDQMIFLKKSFERPKPLNLASDSSEIDSDADNKTEVQRLIRKRKSSPPVVTIKKGGESLCVVDMRYMKQPTSPDPLSNTSKPRSFTDNEMEATSSSTVRREVESNDSGLENSRSMHFFRGIAPTVDKFSDENMIEFQYLVLSIVKQIKSGEQKT